MLAAGLPDEGEAALADLAVLEAHVYVIHMSQYTYIYIYIYMYT